MHAAITEWLKQYASKPRTQQKYRKDLEKIFAWAKINDEELVKEYEGSNPNEFAKKWGKKIIV